MLYSSSEDEAKDYLQDVMIKIFNNIQKYSFSGSFEGWAKIIAKNFIFDEIKKKKKFRFILSENETEIPIDQFSLEEPEEDFMSINNLSFKTIIEEIQKLPMQYRATFNMYAIEEMPHKEIAKELGISESTSKSNYHKAKRNLIKSLQNYGRIQN